MECKIIIAGFGGQGVLFAGKILAQAAANEGFEVSWLPSYGPEMRGGTANCRVVISDSEISSPSFKVADILIAMNAPSLSKFEEFARDSVITDISYGGSGKSGAELIGIDSDMRGGQFRKLTNMLMLGVLAAKEDIISSDAFVNAIQSLTTVEKAVKDIKAFEAGYGFYKENL
jgi:2-oxoglutarate ferredoxin oxidoreductase subunit gamma